MAILNCASFWPLNLGDTWLNFWFETALENVCCCTSPPGIYCDLLHIVDLQVSPDCITSSLLELDEAGFDLSDLHARYINWCSQTGVLLSHFCHDVQCGCCLGVSSLVVTGCKTVSGIPHASRASRKLFNKKFLQPSSTVYPSVSQKVLKGIAARFVVYFLSSIVYNLALENGDVHSVQLRLDQI